MYVCMSTFIWRHGIADPRRNPIDLYSECRLRRGGRGGRARDRCTGHWSTTRRHMLWTARRSHWPQSPTIQGWKHLPTNGRRAIRTESCSVNGTNEASTPAFDMTQCRDHNRHIGLPVRPKLGGEYSAFCSPKK